MIKNWRFKFLLCLISLSITNNILEAQALLSEITLEEQIKHASLIVEGKVLDKKSFWDSGKNNIYTRNTVEVYKVFKGKEVQQIDVITKGGQVGMEVQLIMPGLQLREGNIGVFVLYDNGISDLVKSKSTNPQFKVFSSVQGFYKYNLFDDVVLNSFRGWKGISESFYEQIANITQLEFKRVKPFDSKALTSKLNNVKSALAPNEISFSPTTTSAGTKSTITITLANGANGDFGDEKGTVSFRNADTGGVKLENGVVVPDFIEALDTQILSWTSSRITVQVPSKAGTGTIRVTDANSSIVETGSDNPLEILYSELNVVFEITEDAQVVEYAFPTRLVDNDQSGGYVWQMEKSFDADLENPGAKDAFVRALDTWRCETGVNFTIGEITDIDKTDFDDVNVIRFDNGSELESGTLGATSYSFNGCGAINAFQVIPIEMDLVFNDDIDWHFGVSSPGRQVDFESVALHELGHAHQLSHVIDDTNDVMHFSFSRGEELRSLSEDNKEAANRIKNRSIRPISCFVDKSRMKNYQCPLSIEDIPFKDAITIFPNPAEDAFFIKRTNFVNLESAQLYDLNGRLINVYNLKDESNQKPLSIRGLLGGVYLLKIIEAESGDFLTKKLIVK